MSAQDGFALPDLRVVELDLIVPHEDFDERRIAALAERVQRDGKVRNPPIVAPIGDGRYVVLDGANRVSALKYLEYRDAVVQVVDYEAVELHSWNHLIVNYQDGDLIARLRELESIELRPCDVDSAHEALAAQEALAFITLPGPDHQSYTVHGGGTIIEQAASLRELVQAYNGYADIHRVRADDIEMVEDGVEDLCAMVVCKTFRPQDVLAVVRAGGKLPSGISRHVIPRRALRVNFPLDRLANKQPREEKNAWLERWIRQKMLAREIRYYQEATILYDE